MVQVLTTGSWPTQSGARCNLPRELERGCEEFKAFYLASHSGRKLSWQTNMGNAGVLRSISSPSQTCTWVSWGHHAEILVMRLGQRSMRRLQRELLQGEFG